MNRPAEPPDETKSSLSGVRVLDFARFFAAPFCGMTLADMGAEVIRVEKPGGNKDRTLGPYIPNSNESIMYSLIVARNKKAITLQFGRPKGKELLEQLVAASDVVLHNFVPDSKEAAALDYDLLAKINPRIIVAWLTGFGAEGPYKNRTCFDSIGQAMSGAMSSTGFPNTPPTRFAAPPIDFSTGALTALGIVLALFHRERTGEGQLVDTSMLDTAVSMCANGLMAEHKLLGIKRPQLGNSSFYNFSDLFRAKDGWMMISVIGDDIWRRFARQIGREDLATDPRLQDDYSRYLERDTLRPVVHHWVSTKTIAEVSQELEQARVPFGPVYTIDQVISDPQVKAREMVVDIEYPELGLIPLPGVPIKLSRTPGKVRRRAARVGEHNEEVYCGLLGLKPEELRNLMQEGLV